MTTHFHLRFRLAKEVVKCITQIVGATVPLQQRKNLDIKKKAPDRETTPTQGVRLVLHIHPMSHKEDYPSKKKRTSSLPHRDLALPHPNKVRESGAYVLRERRRTSEE